MKNRKAQLRFVSLLSLILLAWTAAYGQITPSDDAYVSSSAPTSNFGAATTLDVTATSKTAFIRFDLSSVPSSYTGANVVQATLKLYVNTVPTAGSFNVNYVTSSWTEQTITESSEPGIGSTIVSNVNLTTASKGEYVLIDVTPALAAWLNGTETNDGIALVGNSPLNATFDSKENIAASHPPELDVVFTSGGITGVTTASESGLTGGGTSGTLNLSLTNKCAANQVLQWNGTAWLCASLGTGTVTGVTAGTDLTGGGTSGTVTLSLNTASTDARYAQLAAANTFTGNQTVIGNLIATGIMSGSSFEIGSNLFAFGNFANGNAFLGFAGNATMTGSFNTASGLAALSDNTTGTRNTANGYGALSLNTTGNYNTASGLDALFFNSSGSANTASGYIALISNGAGYSNTANGAYALEDNSSGAQNTATGDGALASNTTGNNNTASGYQALYYNTGADAVQNTASGYQALYFNTSGCCNTANGSQALFHNTTGNFNTAVGTLACSSNTTGSDLNCMGYNSDVAGNNLNNATAIGAHALVTVSNAVVLGSVAGVNGATATARIGIGTTSPTNLLTLGQGAGPSIADGWATYSSRRWKTNIQPLHDALGMIERLQGVSYDLKDSGKHEIGVIAEEVGKVVPEVVSYEENGKDARGVDYSRLTALLIEATKEQQALIRHQQKLIGAQQTQIRNQQRQIRAAQAQSTAQQAQIAQLVSQVQTIQVSLSAGRPAGSEVRTASIRTSPRQ